MEHCQDQSNAYYDVGNEIIYNVGVLKSNLFHYNNAYILILGDIIATAHNIPTLAAFKKCAPLTKFIAKIDGTTIDNAENLDLVIPMSNLMKYSSNYSKTKGRFMVLFKR